MNPEAWRSVLAGMQYYLGCNIISAASAQVALFRVSAPTGSLNSQKKTTQRDRLGSVV